MKILFLLVAFSQAFVSCSHKQDKKDVEALFVQSSFDKTVVDNLLLYDSVKNIAITHLDTIFRFRNNRHIVDYSDGKGHIDKHQEDQPSYSFTFNFISNSFIDHENNPELPDFIEAKLSPLFIKLGKGNIGGFTLNRDTTVEFAVRGIESKNAEGGHYLIWNRAYSKTTYSNLYIKDTVIGPNWTYQIYVEEKLTDDWPR